MRSLLVLSGGHPYEAGPFDELLGALGHWEIKHLIHPEGGEADAAAAIAAADGLLFYDMAGYTFGEGKVTTRAPSPAFREAIAARFAAGKGAVVTIGSEPALDSPIPVHPAFMSSAPPARRPRSRCHRRLCSR